MPDPQGFCEYAGFTRIIGGDYTESRTVHPGVFRLRTSAEPTFAKHVGPLTIRYGSTSWTHQNCAAGTHVQRIRKSRNAYEWSIKVYDKRWKWRYPRISGHYNVRPCSGSIEPGTEKTLAELLYLLLNALGEPNTTLRNIPLVSPTVHWNNAYAGRELEWLCDWAGLVICPQRDGVILIEGLGRGAALPNRSDNITPVFTHNQSVMPSHVELRTGKSTFQSLFNLESVGLETDGSVRKINNLSYAPNWSTQWYTTFSDVSPAERHLAFRSVWRWYRIESQDSDTGSSSLETMKSLRLLERLAESPQDDWGVGRCPDAVVKGIFWPLGDHKANTPASARYSGAFRVVPNLSLLAFEYPVIKWTGGLPDAATLKLYVSYNAVAPTGEYIDEAFIAQNQNAITTTAPRVEKRTYLSRVRAFDSPYSQSSDNLPGIEAEATEYLNAIIATYGGGAEKDMLYGGLIPLDLSGRIAQIGWYWGKDRIATTRASENHEFDVTQQSHQARRRQERLGQMWDKWMESQ